MENAAQAQESPFHTFEIKPQLVAKGKKSTDLAKTDMIRASVQVIAEGGENNLHAHAAEDAVWVVLNGQVTFYGEGDKVVARLGKYQGLMIPRGVAYWFENANPEEPLVILRVGARDPNRVNQRINVQEFKVHEGVLIEGAYFQG